MPYIDSKISVPVSDKQKETLKTELGKIITCIPGKSENFLMVGFQDQYSLFFKGNALEKGAFVEVKIFGSAPSSSLDEVTDKICTLYENELGIPGQNIYVKYEFVSHWGWNHHNF